MYALDESLAFLLNRAGSAVANAFSKELRQCGLTLPMWRVLAALWSRGNQSLSGLAEVTSTDLSTLSRQVGSLAARKLITREQSGVNGRAVNIILTPAGRAIVDRLIPAVQRHEGAALDHIAGSEVRRLKQLLKKVYDNIVEFDEALILSIGDENGP